MDDCTSNCWTVVDARCGPCDPSTAVVSSRDRASENQDRAICSGVVETWLVTPDYDLIGGKVIGRGSYGNVVKVGIA
jgi:hypothetical protein